MVSFKLEKAMKEVLEFEPTLKISERLYFFNNGGESIMWCDYSKSGEDQMIALFDRAFEASKTAGTSVKILSNFKSTPKSPRLTKRMRESGKWFRQNGINIRIAVVGMDNAFTRIVMNTTMTISRVKNLRLFEEKEEALKWLSA